jgi:hypothetical protein
MAASMAELAVRRKEVLDLLAAPGSRARIGAKLQRPVFHCHCYALLAMAVQPLAPSQPPAFSSLRRNAELRAAQKSETLR